MRTIRELALTPRAVERDLGGVPHQVSVARLRDRTDIRVSAGAGDADAGHVCQRWPRAALPMNVATTDGCDSIATWLACTVMAVAFICSASLA